MAPRRWLRGLALVGGALGLALGWVLLRRVWETDRRTDAWAAVAPALAGVAAAVGIALAALALLDGDRDPRLRGRGWAILAWTGAILFPGFLAGLLASHALVRRQQQDVVLPQVGGEPGPPRTWASTIPPVFAAQFGEALTVAGCVLLFVAWWRHGAARRAALDAELDSGRWE